MDRLKISVSNARLRCIVGWLCADEPQNAVAHPGGRASYSLARHGWTFNHSAATRLYVRIRRFNLAGEVSDGVGIGIVSLVYVLTLYDPMPGRCQSLTTTTTCCSRPHLR